MFCHCLFSELFLGFCFCLTAVAWHPVHEGLFASGGSDGSLLFWHVGYVPFTVWENDKVCLYTYSHTVWQQRCLGSLVLSVLAREILASADCGVLKPDSIGAL